MFALKKLLTVFILPPTSLLLLALLGFWLARRYPRLGRSVSIASIVALLLLSTPWLACKLQKGLEQHPPISQEALAHVDAIVVLAGGAYRNAPEYGGDTISQFSLERVRYAAHLYQQRKLPILVTGGAPGGGTAEGKLMQSTLEREFNTPVRWVEKASYDTADNASMSAAILKPAGIKKIALVSHGWHLARAIPLFERQGFTVVAAPTIFTGEADQLFDYIPGSGLKTSRQALHEWLGILANKLAGAS